MSADIFVGDVGTQITLTLFKEDGSICDVSTAGTKEFIFKPPTGASFAKAVSFVTTGVDGQLRVTMGNDFTLAGDWQVQAHLIDGGTENYSSTKTFTVKAHL